MNASIQFLKSIPAVNKMIRNIKLTDQNNIAQAIGSTLAGVLKEMDRQDVTPKYFVGLFLNLHNQFQPFGTQHDADQFMQKLIQDISASNPENAKVIRDCFEIETLETITNTEIEAQLPQYKEATTSKVGCVLGGNDKNIKVGTMIEGIKLGLNTKLEKRSEIDG